MLRLVALGLGCLIRIQHGASFVPNKQRSDLIRTSSSLCHPWNSQLLASLPQQPVTTPRIEPTESSSKDATTATQPHLCTFCAETFASRNALFRHVRATHDEFKVMPTRQAVVLHFGYNSQTTNEQAGSLLVNALTRAATNNINDQEQESQSSSSSSWEILGTTQTSLARARTPALSQEHDCPSALDMLVVNYMAPPVSWTPERVNDIAQALEGSGVVLHGVRPLTDRSLHAEQSCSQHIYQFLLPLSWLPDGDQIAPSLGQSSFSTAPSLRQLKRILRSVESTRLIQQPDINETAAMTNSSQSSSPGMTSPRFGLLRHRAKRPWHNFADPMLRGDASPNNQVVWRIVDRARILGWTYQNVANIPCPVDVDTSQVCLVIEFRGDQFLKQQVRRIMASAVAMVHGWLPEDFIQRATDRQVAIETPCAPTGYLYRAGSRHHAVEMYRKGRQLLEWEDVYRIDSERDPVKWMQQQLVDGMDASSAELWLAELRDEVAPRIKAQLQESRPEECMHATEWGPTPAAYQEVLQMLQQLVETNQWPSTSSA